MQEPEIKSFSRQFRTIVNPHEHEFPTKKRGIVMNVKISTWTVVLVLAILVGASSVLIASGNDNFQSATGVTTVSPGPTLAVGPQLTTIVQMVYDTDGNAFGGPVDMVGPAIGTAGYRQASSGALGVSMHTDFAQPNSTYQIYLTCGPSHALACGFVAVGTLTTDAVGKGSSTLSVPLATLRASPFGCGYRTDHVDLLGGSLISSTLTFGALNYFVPCAGGTAPTLPTEHGDPTSK